MPAHVQTIALVGQVACLVASWGMPQPAKGAFLLASFWFFGANIGAAIYKHKHGGDSVAD